MKKILFFFAMAFLACTDTSLEQELTVMRQELEAAKATIADLRAELAPDGELVHLVLFQLKPDADRGAFMAELKKLEAIEAISGLELGPFEDLGDARALSDYAVIMEMSFADRSAYQQYQEHPLHLALKDNTLEYLAGPPATYDYIKK